MRCFLSAVYNLVGLFLYIDVGISVAGAQSSQSTKHHTLLFPPLPCLPHPRPAAPTPPKNLAFSASSSSDSTLQCTHLTPLRNPWPPPFLSGGRGNVDPIKYYTVCSWFLEWFLFATLSFWPPPPATPSFPSLHWIDFNRSKALGWGSIIGLLTTWISACP